MIEKKVAFIGAGQMGSALLKGMLKAKVISAEQVRVSDKDRKKTEALRREWGVAEASNNREAVQEGEIVLLAVKPQQLEEAIGEIKEVLPGDRLFISIVAGLSTRSLEQKLGREVRVIRVMPNSPALVGKSISVISRGRFSTESDEKLAGQLFSAVGEVVFLGEEYQNRVTALSGSGPAYFYLLVEELIHAGEDLGLSREMAGKLIMGTMSGAAEMLKQTGKDPAELRKMVTSPGGTTEAALGVFQRENFDRLVKNAVEAAVKRAEELGG